MSDDTTTPVAIGLVIIVAAAIAASILLLPLEEERYEPADTTPPAPPSTVWQTTNLPAPLTTEAATVTRGAIRGPVIQVSEPPPAPPTTIPIPPHYEIWLLLAECESGGDWAINTGNGYYGGLQFTLQSWRGAGGWQHAARPDLATPLDQMWAAEVLLSYQGWAVAWPACSRKLGLR